VLRKPSLSSAVEIVATAHLAQAVALFTKNPSRAEQPLGGREQIFDPKRLLKEMHAAERG